MKYWSRSSPRVCATQIMVARDKGYPVPHPIVLWPRRRRNRRERGSEMLLQVAPGDSVVLTFLTCGRCKPCRLGRIAHCEKTFPLSFGGARAGRQHCYTRRPWRESSRSLFRAIVVLRHTHSPMNATWSRSGRDVPLERFGPLGCGIQTGAGAVMNALRCENPVQASLPSARAQLDAQRSWQHGLLEQQPSSP